MMDLAGIPDEPDLRERPEEQIRELAIADTLPAFGRILLDRAGRLWVERVPPLPVITPEPLPVRREPTPWDVFDRDGSWLGTVTTPADTHVVDIGDDRIAGLRRGDGGVRVVVHRIERDTGQD